MGSAFACCETKKEEHYEDANMAKESCPTGAIEEE